MQLYSAQMVEYRRIISIVRTLAMSCFAFILRLDLFLRYQ